MTKINGEEIIEVTAIGGPLVFNTRGFRAACDKFLIGRGMELCDIGGRPRGRRRNKKSSFPSVEDVFTKDNEGNKGSEVLA